LYIKKVVDKTKTNMLKQIFKSEIPQNILFDLLEQICLKTEKYYFIDINSYKKMLFAELHKPFIEQIAPYYHASKQFYVDRDFVYTSFTNIIRQICKHNGIKIESEVKYNQSQYYINFFVFYGATAETAPTLGCL
jgi:hypothetical protein